MLDDYESYREFWEKFIKEYREISEEAHEMARQLTEESIPSLFKYDLPQEVESTMIKSSHFCTRIANLIVKNAEMNGEYFSRSNALIMRLLREGKEMMEENERLMKIIDELRGIN
jgi:hypothetical protein